MAMGPEQGGAATLQHEIVCLDELVPLDDRYRRIDELVDWAFVRELAAPYYAEAVGRPSVDPIVLVKLMLAGALEGIGSMRELLRVASVRLDLRRFLGYGLGERLPVHQTVSDAHSRRFLDGRLFERLFLRSVALCREHDLLEGTHLSVDGFHAEANASLASLRASLAPLPAAGAGPTAAEPSPSPGPPQLALCEPRSGPAPKRKSSNASSRSLTDPDAKLRGKPGQRPHLVHLGHVGVDAKARCVTSCLGERADGYEGDGLPPLLDRARFACPELASVGADQGYAAERVWRDCERRRLAAYVPPQRQMLPRNGRTEPVTEGEARALAARARCKTEAGIRAHKRRMADAEGVIAELKLLHGLGRARCRGTPLFHQQLLLGCTAINLKRLARQPPEASSGAAGLTAAEAQAVPAQGHERAPATDDTRPAAFPARRAIVWRIALSLN
jgi:transposase